MAKEETTEAQQTEVNQLKADLVSAETIIAGLRLENAGLKEKNESLTNEVTKLNESNAALKSEIENLVKAPEAKEKAAGDATFDFNEKKYKLIVKAANIPGFGKLTALEIANDEKAQEWLVTNKSGLIKEIV